MHGKRGAIDVQAKQEGTMNISFVSMDAKLHELKNELKEFESKFSEAKKETSKFLALCGKHEIKAVCIGVANPIVKESVTFPFGASGSVFAEGRCKNDWPVIWKVVEEAGISQGCGNTSQHGADISRLIEGAYQLKNGKWKMI